MSAELKEEYEGEWKILAHFTPHQFNIETTPTFSPLPGRNVTFRFEAMYQRIDSDCKLDLFKLKLVKLNSACISPTLQVSVNVKAHYSDGSIFAFYPNSLLQNVDKMTSYTFHDTIQKLYEQAGNRSEHNIKIFGGLVLKCKMTFIQSSQNTPVDEMKLSKYIVMLGNIKSVYEPGVLSDFTFKVGGRSFPVHKVILAAHSPVFMKMMTQEFLESKNNTVTITDATPEIFDLFLRYLYLGETDDKSWDSLKELYYLADKYDVGFLKTECAAGVISFLSIDFVCEILQLAYSYSDSDIKSAAISFAVNHIKELIVRDDWKELVKSQPMIGYEVTVNFIPE